MDRVLQQSQQIENAKNQLASQYNDNFDVSKQIFKAKQQALDSAKALGAQLVGQERLEAGIALAPIAAKGIKLGVRAAADPQGTLTQLKTRATDAVKSQFKQRTGRDLPTSREDLEQSVREQIPEAERVTERLTGGPGDIEYSPETGFSSPFAKPFRTAMSRPPAEPAARSAGDTFEFKPPTQVEQTANVAEQNRVQRIRDIDPSELKPIESPQTQNVPSLSDQITGLEGHVLNPTVPRVTDPIENIQPSDIGLQLPRVEAPIAAAAPERGAIPISRAQREVFGERDFAPPPPRDAPVGVSRGEPLEGGLRGDQTLARAVPQTSAGVEEQRSQLEPLSQREPEPQTREPFEDTFPSPPQQAPQAPQASTDQLGERLAKLKDTPQPEENIAPRTMADTGKFVEKEVATTAEKTLPEEVAAEAPLLDIPGLGELALAGTLIGGLVKGAEEAKSQQKENAGAPPTPAAPPPTPQMSFDAAPSLNTADYHQY